MNGDHTGVGLTRRQLIAGAAASLGLAVPTTAGARVCLDAQSLGAAAARAGFLFGCSLNIDEMKDRAYVDLVLQEARILTTDYGFKLPYIYPARDRFDFAHTDVMVEFADRHGLPLRAHTLFWDYVNPDWITKLSSRERIYEFDKIIDTIVGRYRGKLHSWDLINECLWPGFGEPGGFRRGAWYDTMGRDYVARAFKRAAAIDPDTIWVINQDITERDDDLGRAVRRDLLRLVDDLQGQGIKVGGVGLQGHLDPRHPFDPGAFEAFLWRFSERKLPVYITELDVLDLGLPREVAERDARIASIYGRFLDVCMKVPAVEAIITWQIADSRSWYRGDWYRSQTPAMPKDWAARPLPFDDKLARKPAWHAMRASFCRRARR